MLKLKRIRIRNFRLLRDTHLELDSPGLVFIRGENGDMPGANSNMAGKTTVMSALCYALYGCDLTGRALAHDALSDGTHAGSVELEFRHASDSVVSVVRKRERNANPVCTVRFTKIDGKCIDDIPDVVQPYINAVFGTQAFFLACHVFGHDERSRPFALQSGRDKAKLLDVLVGASDLERAHSAVAEELRSVKTAIVEADATVATLRRTISEAEREMAQRRKRKREDRTILDGRLKEANEAASEATSRFRAARKAYETADGDVQRKRTVVASIERDLKTVRRHSADRKAAVSRETQRREKTASAMREAGRCELCTKPFEFDAELQAAVDNVVRDIDTRISDLGKEIRELNRTISRYRLARKTAQFDVYRAEKVQYAARRRFETAQCRERECEVRVAQIQSEIDALERLDDDTPYNYRRNKVRAVALERKCKRLNERKAILEFWYEGFGYRGILHRRISALCPNLNAIAERYSTEVFGSGMCVQYSATTELKSGKRRPELELAVYDASGTRQDTLSAGQSARRNIVHTFTMADYARMAGLCSVSLLVLDEVFTTLDAAGTDAVIASLRILASKLDTVFVVEHNDELESRFDNVLTVERRNGTATVDCTGCARIAG